MGYDINNIDFSKLSQYLENERFSSASIGPLFH
jgi:hypothetical protein